MINKASSGCLRVMLFLSIALNVFLFGCKIRTFHDNDWDRQPNNASANSRGYTDFSELRQVANSLGIPEEKSSTLSIEGLVSEIRIKLDETTKYHGKVLSEEEMKVLSICLSDDLEILKTVKEYNNFVRKLNNKKIIVLP